MFSIIPLDHLEEEENTSPALSIKEMTGEHLALFSGPMCLLETVQSQQHVKRRAFNGISGLHEYH